MRMRLCLTLSFLLIASASLASVCELGNHGGTSYVPQTGTEVAAVLINPADCTACPVGIDVTEIHFEYTAAAECDQDVIIRLRSANMGPTGCPSPGKIECVMQKPVKIEAGTNEYAIKLSCPCADSAFLYFIEVELTGGDCASPDNGLVANDTTVDPCSNYYNGNEFSGALAVHADAECCNKPVGNVEESFGDVKSKFED